MPYSVERLPNEPIFLTKYWGKIDIHDVEAAGLLLEQLWDPTLRRVVLIYDTDPAQIDFRQTLNVIRMVANNEDDTDAQQEVMLAFVGTSPMIKLFIDASQQKQFAGQKFPLFATIDDALIAMRTALAAPPEKKLA